MEIRAPEEAVTVPTVDAYELALTLASQIEPLVEAATVRPYLRDQLDRSATAIAIAVARAKSENGPPERRRYYRSARRLAVDVVTILELVQRKHSAFADQVGPAHVCAQSLVDRLSLLAHA